MIMMTAIGTSLHKQGCDLSLVTNMPNRFKTLRNILYMLGLEGIRQHCLIWVENLVEMTVALVLVLKIFCFLF